MAGEWRQSTWGDEISLEYGKALRGHDTSSGAYRVYGSNGAIGWTDQPLAAGPGVVLGRKGAYRGVEYSPNPFFVIDTAYYVVSKREHDMRWLYYAIKHHKLGEIDDGSPIPSTTRAAVYPREVAVPPITEQRAIAHILGTLDDKIEVNRRMSATLEAMARAIFQDWFVAFGPTRAKMEGRPPYLAPDLWSLFPDHLDAEGKPEGWQVSTIGQEVAVVGGTTPSTKEPTYWNGNLHWATPKDLSTLSVPVLTDTERRITPAGLAQIGSGLLPVGSVLLSSRAPIGYLAVNLVPTAINQGFIGMMCDGRLPNIFVWLWTAANMDAIKQKANGSTFQEISKANFRPLRVIVPSARVLAAFDCVVRPLWERLCANVKEQATLAATRDLLLPRLMSGELRVRDAERLLERVT